MAMRPFSIVRVSLPAGTATGSPMTMPSVEKGRLTVNALQEGRAMKRLVAMAQGTTGRPENEASVAMPSPARRAGPGGTSAVMTSVVPAESARSRLAKRRGSAAIAASLAGPSAPDQACAEALQHRAEEIGIAVARDHGAHRGRLLGLQRRQEQELPVPQRKNLGMDGKEPGIGVGRLALYRARRIDELDVPGDDRTAQGNGGLEGKKPLQHHAVS